MLLEASGVETGDEVGVQDAGSAGEEAFVQREHSDRSIHRGASQITEQVRETGEFADDATQPLSPKRGASAD
ncbi:hypothetical protein QL996_03110 [Planococcus sp. APC 4015]|nr:hypothetical protein [Planococcus sp. APC 4015]